MEFGVETGERSPYHRVRSPPHAQLPLLHTFTLDMLNSTAHRGVLYSIPRPQASSTSAGTPLIAFNHQGSHLPFNSAANTLIFLGGLTDGLLTVPYVAPLVSSLPPSWTLVEPILGSSYRQFGISSLGEDTAEISLLIRFFRELRPGGKVVLLGHSTGSQMVMHYLLSPEVGGEGRRPKIDGGIMQGCVSDREAMGTMIGSELIEKANTMAHEYVRQGKAEYTLPSDVTGPIFEKVPVTAKRWLSLASPGPDHDGEDDLFSSDLSNERLEETFGQLGKERARLCWLFGGKDQYVPVSIDKEEMVKRWEDLARKGGAAVDEASGIVQGASHTLEEGGEATTQLIRRVLEFLQRVEV